MSVTHITTNLAAQFNVTASSGTWILNEGVKITAIGGEGISNYAAYHDSTIAVDGQIAALSFPRSGVFSQGVTAKITVGDTGSIDAYNGVSVYGANSVVLNQGAVTAANIGLYGRAANVHLSNEGSIAANFGFYLENAYNAVIDNNGHITGNFGIILDDSQSKVTLGADSVIDVKLMGLRFSGNHTNILDNAGTIVSASNAISGGVGREMIVNHGTIKGSIHLGGGDDSFDNRGGTIDHAIDGGAGNDTYYLNSAADTITDVSGNDMIGADFTTNLANYDGIEWLSLTGTGNINGKGNALVNALFGNTGNNNLDGTGDGLVDTLAGDYGNDTYVLGNENDIVIEYGTKSTEIPEIAPGIGEGGGGGDLPIEVLPEPVPVLPPSAAEAAIGGIDKITSTISRDLADYGYIENLTLLGIANVNGTGNGLVNTIVGNAGNNILSGGVETVAVIDTLNGGAGNDTYVLGTGADKVIDSAGTDLITSLVSRNLGSFASIENLKLLGSSAISGIGNGLDNTLSGNAGANALSGMAGNDVLLGGGGADKLDGGADIDTVSYFGASAGVVANLAAPGANTGDAKGDSYVSIENLTGTGFNDMLTGNAGNNVLLSGTGADKLMGGAGADTFLFKSLGDSTVAAQGQDTIFDFSHGEGDTINLSGIDANSASSGDQSFVFKGTAAFSGAKGELHYDSQASDTYVYGDVDGDKVADFVLHFDDAIAFQSSDFLL